MDTLQKAGVAAGAVRHPMDLLADPHLEARFWQWIERAYVGRHPQPRRPIAMEKADRCADPAATLGQYNDEVLGGCSVCPSQS